MASSRDSFLANAVSSSNFGTFLKHLSLNAFMMACASAEELP
jgi:hypothetical protein